MIEEISTPEQRMISTGHCPDCSRRGFVLGPRGGMAINIECANLACRARFNAAFYSGTVLTAQRIRRQAEGGVSWPSDPDA